MGSHMQILVSLSAEHRHNCSIKTAPKRQIVVHSTIKKKMHINFLFIPKDITSAEEEGERKRSIHKTSVAKVSSTFSRHLHAGMY